jgi:two-component system invasion response regulator UvrY
LVKITYSRSSYNMPLRKKIPAVIKLALVDDHVLLRQSLRKFILAYAKECSIVLEADHGRVLAEQLNGLTCEKQPDIVILDINMPYMDGYETIRWLKQYYSGIKIIMLSMFSDKNTIIRCLRLGANAYLVKNIEGEELIYTIRTVLEKGEYYSPFIAGLAVASLKQDLSPDETQHQMVLTKREREFLQLACSESSYKDIAEQMFISPRTVDIYRNQLFEKLKVKTRVGLVMYAINNNIFKS